MYLFDNIICQFSLWIFWNVSILNLPLILLQINSSYLSRMALVGFQYELVSLDVNEDCFDEEQDMPNLGEN